MKRTPLTAMLTLLAVCAATVAVAGCGGKPASSSKSTTNESTTGAPPSHKYPSKPAY